MVLNGWCDAPQIRKLLSAKFNNKESKVRNTFRKFDVNRDGQISHDEFVDGLRNLGLGLSEEQVSRGPIRLGLHRCRAI